MIVKIWNLEALFLMIVSPVFLVLNYGNLPLMEFFAASTLIGLSMAIQESRIFFYIRGIDKMWNEFLEEQPVKKSKQKRCKICGQFKTYVAPLKRSTQKSKYICYNCSRKQ